MLRLRLVLTLLVISLVAAGCTSAGVEGDATSASKAARANAMLANPPGSDVVPTGVVRDYSLYLHPMSHEVYPGATMGMWGFSLSEDPATASIPGPTLRVTEGDTVRVTLVSTIAGFNHTLHFHGQNVPNAMDGVPYMTQDVVEPGDPFTYEFIAKPSGTYWYHCHVDTQHHVDMGMYGVLIVDPQDVADDPAYDADAEFVMVLDEMDRFHIESGQTPTGSLPQGGDYYSTRDFTERTANDVVTRNAQTGEALSQSNTTIRPNRDWYPVTYAPYTATYNTWLINGVAYPYTETLVVKEGQTARIRLVNAGNSIFAMHLHGHHMLVTHKDGVLLNSPYWVDVIPIAPGERYDLYVKLDNPGMWDFHDHIATHTQNDNIFPGGAMTMLCYDGVDTCAASGGHAHGGSGGRSGDLLKWSGHELA